MFKVYPFYFCPYCGHKLKRKKTEGKLVPYCPRCNRFIYENPVPAVAMLVCHKRGLLLVKRKYPPRAGWWALPSGFINMDESPEEAAFRELREETGLKGLSIRLLGVESQKSKYFKRVLVIGYEIETPPNSEPVPGDDAKEVKFFKSLPEIAFVSHKNLVKKFLLKRKECIKWLN